ncbi:MAG: hypothetical protein EA401_11100 [Planctomycetota bacterium]|nr:MAG: hypothetical protein EA401_11100 [Planctomycetota bacterium]
MIRSLCTMACASLLAGSLLAEEYRPWQSLDEETVVSISLSQHPQAQEAFAATALGQLFDSEVLVQRIEDFLRSEHPDIYQPLNAGMTMFGFSFSDIPQLVSGSLGAGLQLRPGEGSDDIPDYTGFVWLTPGADLNQRLIRALAMGLEMQDGPDEKRVTRWDHQVGDYTVIELRGPSMETAYVYDDEGNMQVEDRPVSDDPTFLVVVDGDRLLLSIQPRRDDSSADQERLVSFVQASAQQQVRDFGSRILESASLSAHLRQDGPAQWEMYGDIPRLMSLIPEAGEGPRFGPSPQDIMQALGVNQLGLIGMRNTIVPNRTLTNVFIEAASPRPGLLAILDQEPLSGDMPAWIQDSVMDGQVLRFDLAKVYEVVYRTMVALEPSVEMGFNEINQGATMFLGSDVPTILAAFGDVHEFVLYPQSDEEIAAAEAAMDPDDPSTFDNPLDMRMAWVMNARNPDLVAHVINTMATMGGYEIIEEQGYMGFRIEEMGVDAAIFHGNDQVVIALGDGIAERAMNLQRNPPDASQQLANNQSFLALKGELPQRPVISLAYQNTAQSVREAVGFWNVLFTAATGEILAEFGLHDDGVLDAFTSSVFPEREEFTSAFGITVQQLYVDEQGFGGNFIMELPAKD